MASGDSRTIDILLRFLTDRKGAQDAIQTLGQIRKSAQGAGLVAGGPQAAAPIMSSAETFKAVQEYMRDFGGTAEQAARSLSGMAVAGGKTEAQILADLAAMKDFDQATQQTAGDVQDVGQKVDATTAAVEKFGRAGVSVRGGFAIRFLGTQFEQLGKSILNPIQKYVDYAGLASQYSQDWLDTQQRIQIATVRIGEDMIQHALPAMQSAANLAEKVADFIDKYPNVAAAAAVIGAGTFAIGGILNAIGTTLTGFYGISTILKMASGGAAGTAAGAAAGGAGAAAAGAAGGAAAGGGIGALLARLASLINPVTGGIVLGGLGYNALAGVTGGPDLKTMGAQLATSLVYGFSQVINPAKTNEWTLQIARLTGAVQDLGNASEKSAAQTQAVPNEQAVNAFIAYQQAEAQATQQYEQQRSQIVQQGGAERARIEQQYEQQRSQLVADFQRQQAQESQQYVQQQTQAAQQLARQETSAEQSYYDQRLKAAKNYQKDVQRAEEDHQRELRKLQQDHQAKLADLAANFDALGIYREMRSYDQSRRDLEDTYQVQARRRNQDYADQISEMEQNFAQQRAQRMADYAQQQADQAAQYQARRAQEQADFAQRLKDLAGQKQQELAASQQSEQQKLRDLDQSYRQEQTQRRNAFADQLRDLNANLLGEQGLRRSYYQQMSQDLDTWLKQYRGQLGSLLPGYSAPSRQSGGYTTPGLYQLHDEFVLNPSTTKLAERLVGSRLNQANILASLAYRETSGAPRNLSVSVQQTGWRFEGSWTEGDKKWFQRAAAQAADKSIRQVLEAA